jgi:hypothetical protein
MKQRPTHKTTVSIFTFFFFPPKKMNPRILKNGNLCSDLNNSTNKKKNKDIKVFTYKQNAWLTLTPNKIEFFITHLNIKFKYKILFTIYVNFLNTISHVFSLK